MLDSRIDTVQDLKGGFKIGAAGGKDHIMYV